MRKITVRGLEFRYKVGRSHVDIRRPDGVRLYPTLSEVSGLSVDEVERGKWKRWFSITPSMLRNYIEKHLLSIKE